MPRDSHAVEAGCALALPVDREIRWSDASVRSAGMREKAEQCRRLARLVTVPSLRRELEQIAREFEREVVGQCA